MAGDPHRATADALDALTAPGGLLHTDAPLATWRRYATGPEAYRAIYDASRLRTHAEIVERYLGENTTVRRDGFAAVVTAGSPGAGKTKHLDEAGYDQTWRRIDADQIKVLLIEHDLGPDLDSDPAIRPALERLLPDGRPVMPLELAALFHHESTRLADQVRAVCLGRGENVVIEGTLSYEGLPSSLALELGGYDSLDVVLVEVDCATALRQALGRWWTGREDGGMGGRFTPTGAITGLYEPDGSNRCAANAHKMVDEATRMGLDVTLKSF